jgi:hypothetical protein
MKFPNILYPRSKNGFPRYLNSSGLAQAGIGNLGEATIQSKGQTHSIFLVGQSLQVALLSRDRAVIVDRNSSWQCSMSSNGPLADAAERIVDACQEAIKAGDLESFRNLSSREGFDVCHFPQNSLPSPLIPSPHDTLRARQNPSKPAKVSGLLLLSFPPLCRSHVSNLNLL